MRTTWKLDFFTSKYVELKIRFEKQKLLVFNIWKNISLQFFIFKIILKNC